ncbi:hypothetical protein ASPACDRAFT_40779 [Aspergillus aculeatus ATCC 16872]|uniref:Zn(2)-C6 fungal-type domain-containing protein n=1 Tax=Aspergillus aculeatus (strain ATCC 16872 / CBS 172.66 / WB 5094) TaxID=690307 RepID=A0A1L9X0L3_ASPA1|nr:uncharacterized protein ASPACDRAFT_40779 [Aspergillus aculeatus ATCC 16872]OJK01963.1 hypothetical protein ASPACDRAFT_40779 [Aspergillus aculeatus ATCC 16872]
MQSNPPSRIAKSPRQPSSDKPKRRRKALSCYACRRRKLKCDREVPACGRCRNGGIAESCSYNELPLLPEEERSVLLHNSAYTLHSPPPARAPVPQVHSVRGPGLEHPAVDQASPETRVISLAAPQNAGSWQLLGASSSATGINEERPSIRSNVADDNDGHDYGIGPPGSGGERLRVQTTILRGENFKTHYYGSTNPISLISHFPELRSFMKETIMQRTSLPSLQRELKALQVKWKGMRADLLPQHEWELVGLLPDPETIDAHVQLYFDTFETVYRILHYPSFMREYETFREDSRAARPAFVVTLMLVLACVGCLAAPAAQQQQQPKYIGDSAMARERATLWIEAAEAWLPRQSQKHIYLAIWQIRCLLLVAKMVNVVKKKRTWTAAGTLVREAMSAGFHRDPTILGDRVSVFDLEMRRRLWATILELELQISTDRGMPSAGAALTADTAPPLNIDDEALAVDAAALPPSQPAEVYTACSFLRVAASSFPLRTALNSLVNDIHAQSVYEEVLRSEERITAALHRLPRWPDDDTRTPGVSARGRNPALTRALLDIQLRHFLILLHAPLARQADTNPRYSLSRMVCFNAAFRLIDQHRQLTEAGNHLLLLLRHDYFKSALVICHNMYIATSVHDNLLLQSNSTTLIHYIEAVLHLLEEKTTRLGTGYTHYWYIAAAAAFLRSRIPDPAHPAVQKEEAIYEVVRQYHRVLAHQEDLRKAKELLFPMRLVTMNPPDNTTTTTQLHLPPDLTGASLLDPDLSRPTFSQEDLSLEEFFFGNPAAWTFDNLWAME